MYDLIKSFGIEQAIGIQIDEKQKKNATAKIPIYPLFKVAFKNIYKW